MIGIGYLFFKKMAVYGNFDQFSRYYSINSIRENSLDPHFIAGRRIAQYADCAGFVTAFSASGN